jgi:hypothetical protein
VIETTEFSHAPPELVHRLLVDIPAWSVWSPHVAEVQPAVGQVEVGDVVRTRAWFAPRATDMVVTGVEPGRGMSWRSTVGPWTLRYENRLEPEAGGTLLRFEAELDGPGAGALEAVVAPLSRLGQRRRMRRLARLAELVHEGT